MTVELVTVAIIVGIFLLGMVLANLRKWLETIIDRRDGKVAKISNLPQVVTLRKAKGERIPLGTLVFYDEEGQRGTAIDEGNPYLGTAIIAAKAEEIEVAVYTDPEGIELRELRGVKE